MNFSLFADALEDVARPASRPAPPSSEGGRSKMRRLSSHAASEPKSDAQESPDSLGNLFGDNAEDAAPEVAVDEEEDEPIPPTSRKGKGKGKRVPKEKTGAETNMSKKNATLLAKAHATFEKTRENHTDANLWNNKVRERAVNAAIKTLNGLSTQLLTIQGNAEASALCEKINAWCDDIEPRFKVISSIRKDAVQFAKSVDDTNEKVLKSMTVTTLSTLLLHTAAECLKIGIDNDDGSGEESSSAFFDVCECRTNGRFNTSFILAAAKKADETMATSVCSNFQQQLVSLWYDRLFKVKQTDKFGVMATRQFGCNIFWFSSQVSSSF